jgi:hypothetical protein
MNEFRYYDHQFNGNEWFIIISIIVGTLLVFLLPKRFTKKTTYVFLLVGVFNGFFFDHIFSVLPVSYYDINDNSSFQFMDFLSHIMYAPYSYFFFYLYDFFKIKPHFSLLYILVWSFISVGIEGLCVYVGIFHYQHGYKIYYSFVIYLLVHSIWIIFYRIIKTYGDKQY